MEYGVKHGAKCVINIWGRTWGKNKILYWGKTWGCIQLDYGVNYGVEKHGVIIFYRL